MERVVKDLACVWEVGLGLSGAKGGELICGGKKGGRGAGGVATGLGW